MPVPYNFPTVVRRLRRTLFRQRLVLTVAGLLLTVAAIIVAALLLSLLAAAAVLPVPVKVALLGLLGVALAAALVWWILRPLWVGTVDEMAVRLEQKHPHLKGRLIAAVQFARMKPLPGYSQELVRATEQQALDASTQVDFAAAVSNRSLVRSLRYVLPVTALALLLVAATPTFWRHAYDVYSNPLTLVAPPLGYQVLPIPGSCQWVKYRDIRIGAALVGGQFPPTATVSYRPAGGSWQSTTVDLTRLNPVATPCGDSLAATVTLRQVNRSFDYYVEAGRLKTETYAVDVVDRPRVTGIKLSIHYPSYTGLTPVVIDENDGSFSAVIGSRADMEVTTNLPVRSAELVFADSSRLPLEVGHQVATGQLAVRESRTYYISLTDRLGEGNPDPIQYNITAVPDEVPTVEVLSPGFDVNLGDNMVLPMKVRIYDDFGFTSLAMKYQIFSQGRESEEHVAMLGFSDRIKTEGDVEFAWDLGQFSLFPGDWVAYQFEVTDNDQITGPKVGRSRQFVARVPSLDEIVAQTEAESTQRIYRTQDILKQGHEMADKMRNAARKLEAQQNQEKADWQQQKELSNIAEQSTQMVNDLEKMAQEMEKSVDNLAEQSHLSREILEKMAQIQKLFEEVATPEMKEAQKRLMEALKNMSPDELKKAVEQFQMSLDELLQRLERTLALLKRLQLEQNLEALLQRLEQLVQAQEGVNHKTDSIAKESLPSVSPREDSLRSTLEQMQRSLDQLEQLAQEAQMSESPNFQEFTKQLRQTDANVNMQQMSQALGQRDRDEASRQGKQAWTKLTEMLDRMQQEFSAMKGASREEIERALRIAIDDANFLSQNQENLHQEADQMAAASMALRDFATQQQDLRSSCSGLSHRIAELGKQSPYIAAELEQLLNSATGAMDQAVTEFSDKRRTQGMDQQREAMADLNLAAMRLMESLQQQKQCNKGGSCDKNLSQMQSLCDRQNLLNQMTQQCQNPSSTCPNPGSSQPQFDLQGREGMQRLAGEQGAVRQSLEELARQFGDSREVLGRLDDIAREMKDIEEDLASGQAGEETIDRQLRVYSRMLQASRSLQRRDFVEQRRSNTARENLFQAPPALGEELLKDNSLLEDRLRKYLSEEYPPQYEQQIKAYFRALLQIDSNAPAEATPAP